MADDKDQVGAPDRARVAAGEPYEVETLASKYGLTQEAARALIADVGPDRAKVDAAAKNLSTTQTATAPPARRKTTPAKPRTSRSRGAASGSSPRATARSAAAPSRAAETSGKGAAGQAGPAKTRPSKAQASTGPSQKRRASTSSRKGDLPATPAAIAPLVKPVADLAASAKAVAKPARKRVRKAAKTVGRKTESAAATAAGTPAAMARAVRDAADRISDGAKKSVTRAKAIPAAARKRAGDAVDNVKTAASSRTAAVIGAAAAGLVTGLAVNLARKAVVQAPSVMAGDWLEAIKTEHKAALGLFDAIEATSDVEPAKRTMLLIQLTHALSKHAFTEENVVYPALRRWGDKADADKLNHDHGYVKQHLFELEQMDKSDPRFLSRIAAFRADIEAHVAEEEEAIFPPLHAALGDRGNGDITALANKEGFKLA